MDISSRCYTNHSKNLSNVCQSNKHRPLISKLFPCSCMLDVRPTVPVYVPVLYRISTQAPTSGDVLKIHFRQDDKNVPRLNLWNSLSAALLLTHAPERYRCRTPCIGPRVVCLSHLGIT